MRAPRSALAESESLNRGVGRVVNTRVTLSLGSVPTVTSSATARSATVLASGPAMSCVCESGITPLRLTSPWVGRRPARLANADGMRIDPHVSDPHPTAAKLAAIAAPVPPLDPPGHRRGSYGFFVCPPRELMLVM